MTSRNAREYNTSSFIERTKEKFLKGHNEILSRKLSKGIEESNGSTLRERGPKINTINKGFLQKENDVN